MRTIKNKIERNPNYAIAYTRFRNDTQKDVEQNNSIKLYAEQNNITILESYEDITQSPKDNNRPEFQRMLNDLKSNNCGKILVYKVDRFSRNILLFLRFEKDFTEMGIEIIFTEQPGMNNKLIRTLIRTIAEEFDDLKGE